MDFHINKKLVTTFPVGVTHEKLIGLMSKYSYSMVILG